MDDHEIEQALCTDVMEALIKRNYAAIEKMLREVRKLQIQTGKVIELVLQFQPESILRDIDPSAERDYLLMSSGEGRLEVVGPGWAELSAEEMETLERLRSGELQAVKRPNRATNGKRSRKALGRGIRDITSKDFPA